MVWFQGAANRGEVGIDRGGCGAATDGRNRALVELLGRILRWGGSMLHGSHGPWRRHAGWLRGAGGRGRLARHGGEGAGAGRAHGREGSRRNSLMASPGLSAKKASGGGSFASKIAKGGE